MRLDSEQLGFLIEEINGCPVRKRALQYKGTLTRGKGKRQDKTRKEETASASVDPMRRLRAVQINYFLNNKKRRGIF